MAIRKTPIYEEELFPPYYCQYTSGTGTTNNSGGFSVTLPFTPKLVFVHAPNDKRIAVGHQVDDDIPHKPDNNEVYCGFIASPVGNGNNSDSSDMNQTHLQSIYDGQYCFASGKTLYFGGGNSSQSVTFTVYWQAWG